MGKGYKRKTRWRTLNIAAPHGEEDDEDGIRDVKSRENGTRNSQHSVPSHKGIDRNDGRTQNGVRGESPVPQPRSQPKIIFDENEYTRITTPRQDVLFKKGYLARKKVWSSNNASTSATPSTTESQSASHSTADGSETTEDQQLLDCRDSGLEEYPPMTESSAHMSYGTFYNPSMGYYYDYPVMVVGPPMPGPPMHNLLAAMPCDAVPLRPIEWVNPAFVPKVDQPYCLIDYETPQEGQFPDPEENGTYDPCTNDSEEPLENGNGSWAESIAGEDNVEEQNEHEANEPEEPATTYPSEPSLETVLAQQLHVSHHVVPPQPYMYPGHYMFGPTLINVNGMTIQSGPMVRTANMPAEVLMYAKRRKKKKLYRRKPRWPIGQDNAHYGLEEEEYSSEADTVNNSGFTPSTRPLNPDCKEFHLRPSTIIESPSTPTSQDPDPSDPQISALSMDSVPQDPQPLEYATEAIANDLCQDLPLDESDETEIGVDVTCPEFSDIVEKLETSKELNGLGIPLEDSLESIVPNGGDDEIERNGLNDLSPSPEPRDSTVQKILPSKSNSNPRKKYKSPKIVREATPGPELEESLQKPESVNVEVIMGVELLEAKSTPSTTNSYKKAQEPVDSQEDSGFESQTFFTNHGITEAVTQWLRRTNSPDLFTGLSTNDSDDDELEDTEPSKNLQGNPMPALSANDVVTNDDDDNSSRQAGEFATRRRKRNSNKRKKKVAKLLKGLPKDRCEFPDKDSVVGMRVAKSTRNDSERGINSEDNDKSIESSRGSDIKTFEQGEIVVRDGRMLEESQEYSGDLSESIEEPDVLEYWDSEAVEPLETAKILGTRSNSGGTDPGLEIVRKYYRLARNSVSSSLGDRTAGQDDGGMERSVRSKSQGSRQDQLIDEGIEVYESCYGGKPPVYFDPHLRSSILFREEGAIPCRVTCCNVQ
ncbi:uncharacterized protein [Fopius arisanus]|uniref:Uncharacterized protein isoform X2 n=1 Tax=Fopius arisanus TaxID=64838 RepID=A0A9R1TKR3_9HYME|nr:PREDICTED: uncharacterized protein LOC105271320 isoform X2 [Fopius arisanus]